MVQILVTLLLIPIPPGTSNNRIYIARFFFAYFSVWGARGLACFARPLKHVRETSERAWQRIAAPTGGPLVGSSRSGPVQSDWDESGSVVRAKVK